MKKVIKLLSVFALSLFVSCNVDQGDDGYQNDGDRYAHFLKSNGTLFVEEGASNEFSVNVVVSKVFSSDKQYVVEIDETLSDAVEGEDFTIISNGYTFIKGDLVTNFKVVGDFNYAELDGKKVVFNLLSVEDADVVYRTSFSLTLVKSCPFTGLNTTSYNADVFAFGDQAPSHSVTLVPVSGTDNQWTVTSTWGPSFVAWATGNPAYEGQYVYSGTIILNDDFTLTVEGDDAWATGGEGLFSPCAQEFSFTLTQGLFTNPFTVDVVMSPN